MNEVKTIGIIGYGNMGSAIVQRLMKNYDVVVFDRDKEKTESLKGVKVADTVLALIAQSDVLILAVKPQDFESVLREVSGYAKTKLIVSIAAGIPTSSIEHVLENARVIRVMPNIGVKIADSETTLCKGRYASHDDLDFVNHLFGLLGKTWIIEEKMIDAATAICGSGPAYIFYDMEKNNIGPLGLPISEETILRYIKSLTVAAESIGFEKRLATEFAAATTGTSIKLVEATGLVPAELRKLVTSKGGTTEAAVKVLSQNGSWSEAAHAAVRRAKELSKNK